MSLPKISFAAPPPEIVLLPDAQFFVRTVPVQPESTSGGLTSQVELALEAVSPFPLAQMYYGYYWQEGAANALVFAAYRKRFPVEQSELWVNAEAVLPTFATVLAAKVTGATTIILHAPKSVTAVHWAAANDVPSAVLVRQLEEDCGEAVRETARDELVRQFEGMRTCLEVAQAPSLATETASDNFVFKSEKTTASVSREQLDALDVRDKEELQQRRRTRARDLLLWRCFLGAAAALVLCATVELVLVGGRMWQKGRVAIVAQQTPEVSRINGANTLATRIEELSTQRLKYFEMLTLVDAKRPDATYFTSVTSGGVNKLVIIGKTPMAADLPGFQSALKTIPGVRVDVVNDNSRNGIRDFTLEVEFTAEALAALNGGQS